MFIGLTDGRVFHFNFINDGAEGGMTAVVRPVGIDQANFGDGGSRCSMYLK